MTKAAEIDAAFRRTNTMFSNGLKGKKHTPFKPKFYAKSRTDYGEPMDIDAVTHQHDRQAGPSVKKNFGPKNTPRPAGSGLRFEGVCFNCGKKGHMALDCRQAKNERGKPQEPRRNPYNEGKKKFTPTQMRQHIRALLTETFDEDSEEYQQFLAEVDEQGF